MVHKFADSSRRYHTPDYEESLRKWTREARIHRGLEVELILSATLKSRAFRRAYAYEYAAAYNLDPQETERFVEGQVHTADLGYEFLLAAFVPQEDGDDFDDSGSIWRIRLITDTGERIRPDEIRRVKEKDALMVHFYPYITPWKSVYVVRFPMDTPMEKSPDPKGPGNITLEIAGVLGTAEMEWPARDIRGEMPLAPGFGSGQRPTVLPWFALYELPQS